MRNERRIRERTDTLTFAILPGNDRLCCRHGDGYYRIEVKNPDGTWWKAVQGGERMSSKEDKYDVHVGPRQRLRIESRMTERDRQYLEAHNVRRKRYHEGWGKEYVPMKWSEELKKRSKEVSGPAAREV